MRTESSERSPREGHGGRVDSEFETVELGGEGERGASPWEGGAIPLRRESEFEVERERRLEIVAQNARRRRRARRLAGGGALIAVGGVLVFALVGSAGKTPHAPGSLRSLAAATPGTGSVKSPGAASRGPGQHIHDRPGPERRSAHRRPAAASPQPEGAAPPEAAETQAPLPAAPEAQPQPEAPVATAPSHSGAEAAEAEFGFEN